MPEACILSTLLPQPSARWTTTCHTSAFPTGKWAPWAENPCQTMINPSRLAQRRAWGCVLKMALPTEDLGEAERVGRTGEVRRGWGRCGGWAKKLKFYSVRNRGLQKVLRRAVNWQRLCFRRLFWQQFGRQTGNRVTNWFRRVKAGAGLNASSGSGAGKERLKRYTAKPT